MLRWYVYDSYSYKLCFASKCMLENRHPSVRDVPWTRTNSLPSTSSPNNCTDPRNWTSLCFPLSVDKPCHCDASDFWIRDVYRVMLYIKTQQVGVRFQASRTSPRWGSNSFRIQNFQGIISVHMYAMIWQIPSKCSRFIQVPNCMYRSDTITVTSRQQACRQDPCT